MGGDPHYGKRKKLHVVYGYDDNISTRSCFEGETLDLTCFSSWQLEHLYFFYTVQSIRPLVILKFYWVLTQLEIEPY